MERVRIRQGRKRKGEKGGHDVKRAKPRHLAEFWSLTQEKKRAGEGLSLSWRETIIGRKKTSGGKMVIQITWREETH